MRFLIAFLLVLNQFSFSQNADLRILKALMNTTNHWWKYVHNFWWCLSVYGCYPVALWLTGTLTKMKSWNAMA